MAKPASFCNDLKPNARPHGQPLIVGADAVLDAVMHFRLACQTHAVMHFKLAHDSWQVMHHLSKGLRLSEWCMRSCTSSRVPNAPTLVQRSRTIAGIVHVHNHEFQTCKCTTAWQWGLAWGSAAHSVVRVVMNFQAVARCCGHALILGLHDPCYH